ncbi:hypothetical protein [Paenibacillus silviterrae]|nr:hypothetical protein [Paenibacillus chinjuensis]
MGKLSVPALGAMERRLLGIFHKKEEGAWGENTYDTKTHPVPEGRE